MSCAVMFTSLRRWIDYFFDSCFYWGSCFFQKKTTKKKQPDGVTNFADGTDLTHWGRDKMAANFLTTFSNAFSWMKMYRFRLRFHWSLFPRAQLTIFQHWFRSWLGADQATSHYLNQWWSVYWRIYASLGLNELNPFRFKNTLEEIKLFEIYYKFSVLTHLPLEPHICVSG